MFSCGTNTSSITTSPVIEVRRPSLPWIDRKSTRLNSSHLVISYAVFCLKKKKKQPHPLSRRVNTELAAELRIAGAGTTIGAVVRSRRGQFGACILCYLVRFWIHCHQHASI